MQIPKKGDYVVQVFSAADCAAALIEISASPDSCGSWGTNGEKYKKGVEIYVVDGRFNGWCHLGYAAMCAHDYKNYKTIKYGKNNMNLIEKAKVAMKGEPEKSFIKAGVMDINENLTTEGRDLFLGYLLKEQGAAFKAAIIDPILEADKAEQAAN